MVSISALSMGVTLVFNSPSKGNSYIRFIYFLHSAVASMV